ncbi:MAG: RluA family pseudouridine synthase [Planctomycetaceae bacterium]
MTDDDAAAGELSAGEPILVTVEARAHGWRLDHYLSRLFPNHSRALFKKAIEQHSILVNGLPVKTSRRVRVNDRLSVQLPQLPDSSLPAENLPIDVMYEDDALIVLNKAAGMITHPGKGNYRGTLAGALQYHFDKLSDVAGQLRPGIVHRLDRDTSGVLVIAKNNQVHHRLSGQFERREVVKEYRAITHRVFDLDRDVIDTCVRVNPKRREKMCVCEPGGNARQAITHYEVLERFRGFSWMRLMPKTGRTHQLRVHMQHLKHPIVADKLYGGGDSLRLSELLSNEPVNLSRKSTDREEKEDDADILIRRQALHAYRLEFRHPESGQPMTFEAPLPTDIQAVLNALREHRPL